MTIYKYKLGTDGENVTLKGKIRKILKVDFQPGEGVVCWCEVDDRCEEVSIKVVCVGTGWDPLPKEIILEQRRMDQDTYGIIVQLLLLIRICLSQILLLTMIFLTPFLVRG